MSNSVNGAFARIFFLALFCAAFSVSGQDAEESSPLQKARLAYGAAADGLISAYLEKQYALEDMYVATLTRLREAAQKAGSLELVLEIDQAIGSFEQNQSTIDPANELQPMPLRKAAHEYRTQHEEILASKVSDLANLKGKYEEQLKGAVRVYTQKGDIEAAVAVKEEIERLNPPPPPEVEPVPQMTLRRSGPSGSAKIKLNKTWPCDVTDLQFIWSRIGMRLPSKPAGGSVAAKYPLTHSGGNAKDDWVMKLDGGRSVVDGLGAPLVAACQASNELSVEITVNSAEIDQTGPARIFSFSRDGNLRNFSLCQEGGEYRLRLRTDRTGENGLRPEVVLGKVKVGEDQQILFSYRPGTLACFIDGKEQSVLPISGDFRTWTAEGMEVLFGNELRDDRPWFGEVHHVAVYSRSIDADEAQFRYRAQQKGDPGQRKRRP